MGDTVDDMVVHPRHYTQDPVECIEITEHLMSMPGNAIKYIWRYKYKGNPKQDLEKAIFYLIRAKRQKPAAVNAEMLIKLKEYIDVDPDDVGRQAIQIIATATTIDDYDHAIMLIEHILSDI